MALSSANIRTAIIELLEGTIGTTRVVAANKFLFGNFDGQPTGAQQAKAIHTGTSRFDVELGELEDHQASPVSTKTSRKFGRLSVTLPIWTHVPTVTQDSARQAKLAVIESDCETAVQALHYRGNLTATAASGATGIVSGFLTGPDGSGEPEWLLDSQDWDAGLVRSQITAQAIVSITRAIT